MIEASCVSKKKTEFNSQYRWKSRSHDHQRLCTRVNKNRQPGNEALAHRLGTQVRSPLREGRAAEAGSALAQARPHARSRQRSCSAGPSASLSSCRPGSSVPRARTRSSIVRRWRRNRRRTTRAVSMAPWAVMSLVRVARAGRTN